MSRAAPGAQVSEGRIRVDAGKALAKLREYQLADRTAWILEGLRGAVAAGATSITLDGDANDVWLAWEGPALTDAELTGLFDELVSPEATTDRHHLRLIAAAVNSALGMDPAFVDVYALRPAGTVRARYRSDILEGAEALRRLAAEPVDRPERRADGMLVHLRRRFGFEVLEHFVTEPLFGSRPSALPELALARTACREISVPLRIGDTTLHRDVLGGDLLRVKLADLDGFLAIGALAPDAVMTVAERGVAIVDVPIQFGWPVNERPTPLRAYLDAPRMPTNASRSDVRRVGHPVSTAEARVRDALPALVAALVEQATADPRPGGPVEDIRAAIFRLLATVCAADGGLDLARVPEVLRPLLHLPLVFTATGKLVSLGSTTWEPIVHTGPAPYSEELGPWLDAHRWIPPGDAAALLFDPGAIQHGLLARGPMRRRARWARRQLRHQQRFFEHAPRPATLQGSGYYIRAQLGARVPRSRVDPTVFSGLAGEVALLRPDASATNQLVILHTGRVLERVDLAIGISCAAIIDSPRIVPHPGYASAERGPAFDELERVVRAGITCLGEGLAMALAGEPDARFPIVGERDPELERDLIREIVAGLYHARKAIPAVICDAPVWRTVHKTFVSLTALRGQAVIGVGRATAADVIPAGRIVLAQPVYRAMLRHLAPRAAIVDYAARPHGATVDAFQLAYRVAKTTGIALAIEDRDGTSGAIGPALMTASRVGISHTGITLDEIEYEHVLAPVEILVDDGAIVPTADWRRVHDDAGISSRSFEGWELALLRAIAAALTGARPRELVGASFSLGDKPGRVLCLALAGKGPSLLGPALEAALAATPLFEVLGDPVRIRAVELAQRHPAVLDYVTPEAVAAHPALTATLEPRPLVASSLVAGLAAGLAQRTPRDVSSTLADLARQQRRTERLAAHRLKPPLERTLRGLTVPLHGVFTGAVGLGAGALTIVIRVEGRDFGHETRRGAPVEAIVELDETHVDGEFQAVLSATMTDVFLSVQLAIPRLVQALVAAHAETLATPSPGRTFLAAWLESAKPPGPHRDELVAAPLWPAVQGGPRVALAAAIRRGAERTLEDSAPSGKRGTIDELWVATWTGEWLGPAENEFADPLDVTVLLVDDGELRSIYRNLVPARHVDVSAHITRLQSRRRALRGLTPKPTIPNAPPALTRELASLGPEGKALAPGEIALLDTPHACVYLHAGGELRARIALAVLPPVALAIEAPELVPPGASPHAPGLVANDAVTAALERPAQELAERLVEAVLAATAVETLAPAVRKQLARAAMTGMQRLQGAPLFETLVADPLASPPWVQWDKLEKQQARFGDVWYVSEPPPDRVPLDPKRRVFVLAADAAELARANGLSMVEATRELHFDATARRNQARPLVTSLELAGPVLASVALEGDGVTSPRGVVGVLDPSRSSERVLHVHRRGHPFDPASDPCEWPTVAAVELATLAPDRTWANAVPDAAREQLVTAVREASRRALAAYDPARPAFVTVARVNEADCFGAVWLSGAPLARLGVQVMAPTGKYTFVPLHGLGMEGALVTLSRESNLTLNRVCQRAYLQLVRSLALSVPTDDAGLAHLAYAIGTKGLDNAPARIRFPCFAPQALDPAGLVAFLQGDGPIPVIEDFDQDPRPALVLDGSVLASTLLSVVDHRRRKGRPAERKRRATTAPPPVDSPPHYLQPLVDTLHRRLVAIGIRVPAWSIAEDDGPLLRWEHPRLVLAAHHARALAIASHVIAKSPDASGFVDLLAAHAATVMNVALTDITDADERAALTVLARER